MSCLHVYLGNDSNVMFHVDLIKFKFISWKCIKEYKKQEVLSVQDLGTF